MKAIAFSGSPRKNGNTVIMLNTVLAELEKRGIETELIQVGDRNIHGCIACEARKAPSRAACSTTISSTRAFRR